MINASQQGGPIDIYSAPAGGWDHSASAQFAEDLVVGGDGRIYVANRDSGSVDVFDGGANAGAPVDVGGTPIGLFTDSAGNVYAIVADGNLQDDQPDNVSLHNVTTGAPVGGVAYTTILNTSASPAGMIEAAQGSDGNTYITNPLDNSIVVLDSAGNPVRTIDFEPGPPDLYVPGPRPVSVVASGDKVYATVAFADAVNPDAAHLRVVELTSGAVVAEAFVTEPGDYHTALQTDMAVSPRRRSHLRHQPGR